MTRGALAIGAVSLAGLALLYNRSDRIASGTAKFNLIDGTTAYLNVDQISWIREGDTVLKVKGFQKGEIDVVLVYLLGRDLPLRVVHPIEQLKDTLQGFVACSLPSSILRGSRRALVQIGAITAVASSSTSPVGTIAYLTDGTELLLVEPCHEILPGMTRPCR